MGIMTDPCHPGEILQHQFLEPLGLSANGFAQAIGVPLVRVERLLTEQASVTAEIALRLSKALGTTPEFWTNMQTHYNLARARKSVDVSGIEPFHPR